MRSERVGVLEGFVAVVVHAVERNAMTAGSLEIGEVEHVALCAAGTEQELVDVEDPHRTPAWDGWAADERPYVAHAARYHHTIGWISRFSTGD